MNLIASGPRVQVRRVLVIHNPAAGQRRRERVGELVRALEVARVEVITAETTAAGDARRLAAEACHGNNLPDVVVAAGGDGTVNEVANGLLGSSIPLAVLPLGTVNVLFREIGLQNSVREIARAIAEGHTALVWPGLANGRAFLLMTGVGFDAAVVAAVSPALKRRIGQLAYVWAGLRLWWRWQPGYRVLRTDEGEYRVASFIAARCRLYGGSYIGAMNARLDEPHLHLVLFERDGRMAALGYALALVTGQLHRWPGVRHLRTTSSEVIEPHPLQLDGDALAPAALRLKIADQPLRVVCAAC